MNSAKELIRICELEQLGLTFDDVLLVPQYSEIESRSKIDLTTRFTKLRYIKVPIVSANMDTVTEAKMAIAMSTAGGVGVIHRYMDYAKQCSEINSLLNYVPVEYGNGIVAVAIGIKNGVLEHVKNLANVGVNVFVIDVAHGHYKYVGDLVQEINKLGLVDRYGTPIEVIAGNIATPFAAKYLCQAGASALKVGVGPGSLCSTRVVTGHGLPQLTAVSACSLVAKEFDVPVIADGGIRNSGDIVKALAAGASSVMCGSIFAGTEESPGEVLGGYGFGPKYKTYRGMASREAQVDFYGNDPDAPEGVATQVEFKGSIGPILKQLVAGIRSGFSYSGANNIQELWENAEWIRITSAGFRESVPHLLLK